MVILVVALVVFGPKRLPELARSLGKGLAEFRRASSDLRGSFQDAEQTIREPLKESSQQPEAPAQAGDDPEPKPEVAAASSPPPEKEPSGSLSG